MRSGSTLGKCLVGTGPDGIVASPLDRFRRVGSKADGLRSGRTQGALPVTDWCSEAVDVLRDVIDRIIPRDADPSATDLGVDRYILQQMLAGVVPDQDLIRAGLEALSTAIREMGGHAEPKLDVRELDAMLQGAATAPWFQALD